MPGPAGPAPGFFVLLSITFFARRDELWGRFLTCGGLLIRLPPLDAPATALENRHHSLRLCRYAGQVGNPPESLVNRPTSAGYPGYPLGRAQDTILPH